MSPTDSPERPARDTRGEASATSTEGATHVVAVYRDHASAEAAVRKLHEEGFAMRDLSIVGRDFQVSEEPVGFVSTSAGDIAATGAGTGAWVGGLFGLLVGAAFLVLPGVGPVVIAGPLTAALLGGIEGALAGAAIGGISGALIGWGVPREEALQFETHVKAGKFLVVVRGEPSQVARAQELLHPHEPEHLGIYQVDPRASEA